MDIDGVKGAIRACVQLKQQSPQLKVIMSIGGGGNSKHFAAVAADSALRDAFAKSCKQMVDTYQLDGIDSESLQIPLHFQPCLQRHVVDWEHPDSKAEGTNFTLLLAALRTQLPRPLYTLTAALPAAQWCLQNIPKLSNAVSHLTFLNLMAYDFTGSWTSTSGHHSPLYAAKGAQSANAGVQYCLSQGVPSSKLLLGIPCYGRSFLGCDRPGQTHKGCGGEDGAFEYRDLPRPDATEVVDQGAIAAYCVGGDGGFVSYDNPFTVSKKAKFVRQEKLGGLFYWTGTGDKSAEEGLVYNGYTALHSS